jgi:hypothetical protein
MRCSRRPTKRNGADRIRRIERTRVKLSRQGMEHARATRMRAKRGRRPTAHLARRAATAAQFVRCDPVTPVGELHAG